jgi:SAM-dependent methyltransferase
MKVDRDLIWADSEPLPSGDCLQRRMREESVPTQARPAGNSDLSRYLSGDALVGNDFTGQEIAQWFADEKEACFEIRGGLKEYPYHAKNWFYGFRKLPQKKFANVLCFGGGDGAELLPIADRLGDVTILEPSSNFKAVIPASYVAPKPDGSMSFPDNTFDLVTCIGVLHHIPNVSTVLNELYRCTAKGGMALVAEPITSMGGWKLPRAGLSKHERGIPLRLFRSFIGSAGFEIVSENKCGFAPINYIARTFDLKPFNSSLLVRIDRVLSALPFWSSKYHATTVLGKIRATTVFYVLKKTTGPCLPQK